MTEHEFHGRVTAHMARADAHMAIQDERWEAIARMVQEIRSGDMCPVGVRAITEIGNLKIAEADQWKEIGKLRDVLKYSAMVVGGVVAAAATITTGMAIWRQIGG